MLPSRGLSISNPASVLRNACSARSQPARPLQVPIRRFSQAQSRSGSRSIVPSRTLGASSRPTTSLFISASAASSVFAQRSGASRNLSLWPFSSSSKQQQDPTDAQYTSTSTSTSTYTEPTAPVAQPEPDQQPEPSTSAQPEVSSTTSEDYLGSYNDSFSDLDLQSVLNIPEQIGYLKGLGLDFGWGPTACLEWLIEHVYIYSGMPWWATIATVALAWRAALFVPTMNSSKNQALVQQMNSNPEFVNAKAQFEEAMLRSKDRVAQMQAREKMMRIKKQSGVKFVRFLVPLTTIPFSYGAFRLFRGMAAIPVPSLETGGLAWFTDLTVHDPYYILPLASVGLAAAMFQQMQAANMGQSQDPMAQNIQKWMKYVLPPMMFACTAWLPACVQWFFLMFSAGTVVQTSATLNPAVRRWADLPPLPGKGPAVIPAGGRGVVWQAPNSPAPKPAGGDKKDANSSGGLLGNTKLKEQWKKAQEYEERRAQEEKEKTYRRMEDIRRKRAEKGRK